VWLVRNSPSDTRTTYTGLGGDIPGPLVRPVSELKPKLLVEATEACWPGVHERRSHIAEQVDHGVDRIGEQTRDRSVLQLSSCRDAFCLRLKGAILRLQPRSRGGRP
jgi:hypothetical protein